ncbi:MAG: universal stress protein [Pseudomonadota bacterium]
MRKIRKILVAVKNTRLKSSPAIRKAAVLARALGARLELFHVISEPVAIELLTLSNQGLQQFEAAEKARHTKRLEAIAARLAAGGLNVATAVEWDYPVHEALIRRASRTHADLIVAERHVGKHIAPWFLRYADWELLRRSPVPVLVVKNARNYESPTVLAAVDPSHAFAKTSSLDKEILGIAANVSAATGGQLHAVHAYVPTIIGMKPAELNTPDASARIARRAETLARSRMASAMRAISKLQIASPVCHLVARHAVNAIPELARKLACDIVVMGAISRSGLKRVIIGNTAERLLDELPCDLLIVKPPVFASRVPTRSRGSQIVTLMPPSVL